MILSIQSWWIELSQPEQIFWAMAIISSAFFLIQLTLTLIGLDSDMEGEIGVHGGDVEMHGGDGGFAIISIRSLAAFFMFAGWGGVAALSQGLTLTKSIMVASLFGFLAMLGVAYLLALILRLQESGTVNISSAVSHLGDVYVPIPALGEGKGRIQLSLKGKVMEFDAITEEDELATGVKVEVVDVLKDNVMVVKAV